MSGAAIEARVLGKDYGRIQAIEALNLRVEAGSFIALLGPNGAGKTTTVHMLTTLIRPSRGTAIVAGHDICRAPLQVRRNVGLVFQDTTLDRDLTATENLKFAAALYGLDNSTARSRIEGMLELFDLSERRNDRVGSFSGGMKRALDMARGLLHRPPILFLDEPTIGLDPVNRRRIWALIRRLRSESSITVFLTTHYLEEAEDCDDVVLLDRGRVIAQGTPDQLKRRLNRQVIRLEAPHEAGLARDIERALGSQPRETPEGYEVQVESAEDALPRALLLLNAGVRTVQIARPSLEDVFVELTGRNISEEAADEPDEATRADRGRVS